MSCGGVCGRSNARWASIHSRPRWGRHHRHRMRVSEVQKPAMESLSFAGSSLIRGLLAPGGSLSTLPRHCKGREGHGTGQITVPLQQGGSFAQRCCKGAGLQLSVEATELQETPSHTERRQSLRETSRAMLSWPRATRRPRDGTFSRSCRGMLRVMRWSRAGRRRGRLCHHRSALQAG